MNETTNTIVLKLKRPLLPLILLCNVVFLKLDLMRIIDDIVIDIKFFFLFSIIIIYKYNNFFAYYYYYYYYYY